MFQQLLTFFHPTTIYLIDDNKPFIENLSYSLNTLFKCAINTNPLQAIDVIKDNQQLTAQYYLDIMYNAKNSDEDDDTNTKVHYNLNLLNEQLINKQVENIISVIIVDYSMPKMSGIKFCEQLINHPVKKIMLTGKGDHQLAIDAFNAKIIDGFIQKGEDNYIEQLSEMIIQLQHAFFAEMQAPLIANIAANLKSENIYTEVLTTLNEFYKQNHIIKHVMIDTYGSCKMLNDKGQLFFFKVYTPDELSTYQTLAKGSALAETLKGKAPILLAENDHLQPVSSWQDNLTTIQTFKANPNFYYGCGELGYEST